MAGLLRKLHAASKRCSNYEYAYAVSQPIDHMGFTDANTKIDGGSIM